MLNGLTPFLIAPLGAVVYLAALALFFQDGGTLLGDRSLVELLIVVLLTMIGVLLRMGYGDLKKQLQKVQEACEDLRDRVIRLETLSEVDDA